jgi:hypothetical protein
MPLAERDMSVDFSGMGESIESLITGAAAWMRDTAYNAATGKLTDGQLAEIKAETAAQIQRAAGDNLDLAGDQIALMNKELDTNKIMLDTEADAANIVSTPNLAKFAGVALLVIVAGVMTFAAVAAFRST